MPPNFITRRDGLWHYVRRVPASISHLEPRRFVKQSTKIRVADDPRGVKAGKIAEHINEQIEAYWRGLGEGRAAEAQARYDEARRRARLFGFAYLPAAELATQNTREILARIQTLDANESDANVVPILGGETPPKVLLSQLLEEFETITEASRRDFSPNQIRKSRNPRKRAMANFLAIVTDKPIVEITRLDAVQFHDWWASTVLEDNLDVGTANREFGIIARMLKVVDRKHRWGIPKIFDGLRMEGATKRSRPALSIPFVKMRMLAPGALDVIEAEARDVLYLIAETGLRLSEALGLLEARIVLNAPVPHVQVRSDVRKIKTAGSSRDIPLVGVALDAMQRNPKGFPRYRNKEDAFSSDINKILRREGLLEPGRTIYSLRHTFEDRLGEVDAPDKMIAVLMGHKHYRPKYGSGPSLEMKLRWLQKIAFASSD